MRQRFGPAEKFIPWPAQLFVGLVLVFAMVHSIRNRTLGDFVRYPLYIAVPIVSLLVITLLAIWWRSGFRRLDSDEVITIVVFPFLITFVSVQYYAVGAAAKDAYLWLRSASLTRDSIIIIGVIATALFAVVLFCIRLLFRSCYGFTETVVGLAIAHNEFVKHSAEINSLQFYFAALTAVYLIVRGLDNVHQGVTKDPPDPIAKRIAVWINNFSRTPTAGQEGNVSVA